MKEFPILNYIRLSNLQCTLIDTLKHTYRYFRAMSKYQRTLIDKLNLDQIVLEKPVFGSTSSLETYFPLELR